MARIKKNNNKNPKQKSKPKTPKPGKNRKPKRSKRNRGKPRLRPLTSGRKNSQMMNWLDTDADSLLVKTTKPIIQGSTIQHCEFVSDLTFTVPDGSGPVGTEFEINPGLGQTFPWLSKIAQGYESYNFVDLIFEYIPSTNYLGTGNIALVPDFDPDDVNTSLSKKQILASSNIARNHVTKRFVLKIDKGVDGMNKRKSYYTRYTPLTTSKRLTDPLKLQVYVTGYNATGSYDPGSAFTPGELWVGYRIRFHTPQLEEQAIPTMIVTGNNSMTYINPKASVVDNQTDVKMDTINTYNQNYGVDTDYNLVGKIVDIITETTLDSNSTYKAFQFNQQGYFKMSVTGDSEVTYNATTQFITATTWLVDSGTAKMYRFGLPYSGAGFDDNTSTTATVLYEDEVWIEVVEAPVVITPRGAYDNTIGDFIFLSATVMVEMLDKNTFDQVVSHATKFLGIRDKHQRTKEKVERKKKSKEIVSEPKTPSKTKRVLVTKEVYFDDT